MFCRNFDIIWNFGDVDSGDFVHIFSYSFFSVLSSEIIFFATLATTSSPNSVVSMSASGRKVSYSAINTKNRCCANILAVE